MQFYQKFLSAFSKLSAIESVRLESTTTFASLQLLQPSHELGESVTIFIIYILVNLLRDLVRFPLSH